MNKEFQANNNAQVIKVAMMMVKMTEVMMNLKVVKKMIEALAA